METDKQLHWIVCSIGTPVLSGFFVKITNNIIMGVLLGAFSMLLIAIGKELLDEILFRRNLSGRRVPKFFLAIGIKGTGFSGKDLLADIKGIIVGMILFLSFAK